MRVARRRLRRDIEERYDIVRSSEKSRRPRTALETRGDSNAHVFARFITHRLGRLHEELARDYTANASPKFLNTNTLAKNSAADLASAAFASRIAGFFDRSSLTMKSLISATPMMDDRATLCGFVVEGQNLSVHQRGARRSTNRRRRRARDVGRESVETR